MTNSGHSMVFLFVIGFVGLAVVTAAQEEDMATVSAALALRAEEIGRAHV